MRRSPRFEPSRRRRRPQRETRSKFASLDYPRSVSTSHETSFRPLSPMRSPMASSRAGRPRSGGLRRTEVGASPMRSPTASSRAGRPRSGGLRRTEVGARATCPRTARSAGSPGGASPLGTRLFPARLRPGKPGASSSVPGLIGRLRSSQRPNWRYRSRPPRSLHRQSGPAGSPGLACLRLRPSWRSRPETSAPPPGHRPR